eukprot:m.59801 g.59801  ORF g.59801 m.59801 type:complete len:56 (+) comp7240_c0_seq1:960-1127(+)
MRASTTGLSGSGCLAGSEAKLTSRVTAPVSEQDLPDWKQLGKCNCLDMKFGRKPM